MTKESNTSKSFFEESERKTESKFFNEKQSVPMFIDNNKNLNNSAISENFNKSRVRLNFERFKPQKFNDFLIYFDIIEKKLVQNIVLFPLYPKMIIDFQIKIKMSPNTNMDSMMERKLQKLNWSNTIPINFLLNFYIFVHIFFIINNTN